MLKARLLNDSDYDLLVDWWIWWGFEPISKGKLPLNGQGGVMVFKDDNCICAGFLYTTNSEISWMEFIVVNPYYKEKDRKQAKKILINTLCDLARSMGFTSIFTCVQDPFLIKALKDCDFTADIIKSTEMVKLL